MATPHRAAASSPPRHAPRQTACALGLLPPTTTAPRVCRPATPSTTGPSPSRIRSSARCAPRRHRIAGSQLRHGRHRTRRAADQPPTTRPESRGVPAGHRRPSPDPLIPLGSTHVMSVRGPGCSTDTGPSRCPGCPAQRPAEKGPREVSTKTPLDAFWGQARTQGVVAAPREPTPATKGPARDPDRTLARHPRVRRHSGAIACAAANTAERPHAGFGGRVPDRRCVVSSSGIGKSWQRPRTSSYRPRTPRTDRCRLTVAF